MRWTRCVLERKYELKGSEISESGGVVKFLGRTTRRDGDGSVRTADTKHQEILIREYANSVETLLGDIDKEREKCEAMGPERATRFRRAVARLNYMSQDRVDIAAAANVVSRWLSKPRQCDEVVLKRCIRYLVGHPECALLFQRQTMPSRATIVTDSDWAGCLESRRSTTGFLIRWGNHLLCHASKTQKSVG